MKKIVLVASCAMMVAFVSGCRTNIGGGIMSSTRPLEQGKFIVLGDRVEGYESSWILPFGLTHAKSGSSSLRSLDEALNKVPGSEALIEASVNIETVNYFVAKRIITRITGIPVKTKNIVTIKK